MTREPVCLLDAPGELLDLASRAYRGLVRVAVPALCDTVGMTPTIDRRGRVLREGFIVSS